MYKTQLTLIQLKCAGLCQFCHKYPCPMSIAKNSEPDKSTQLQGNLPIYISFFHIEHQYMIHKNVLKGNKKSKNKHFILRKVKPTADWHKSTVSLITAIKVYSTPGDSLS